MFIDFAESPLPSRGSWTDLPDDEALLLWSLRRLVVAWPASRAVEAALHRRWGDEGTGVMQLLRCWLVGLAARAGRSLTIGDPACALLLPDEGAMLFAWRQAWSGEQAAAALAQLCARDPDGLLPLAQALGGFSARATGGSFSAASSSGRHRPRSAPGSASWAASPASDSRARPGRAG